MKWEYSIEWRTRKYLKDYWFLLFSKNLLHRDGKKLIFSTTSTGTDSAEIVSKNS